MKAIGIATTTITAAILLSLLNGVVLSQLWSWFVVSQFHLRPLSIPSALGLGLLVNYLTYHDNTRTEASQKNNRVGHMLAESFTRALLLAMTALLVGAIYHALL